MQAPQAVGVVTSFSQPLSLLLSQLLWAASQTGGSQSPAVHEASVAPAFEQVPVQLPQCWMLFEVSVSQPSAAVQSS